MAKTKTKRIISKVSLRDIFLGLQDQMISRLSLNRRTHNHPVAKGDASEAEWIELLSSYLPKRYQVEKAFILDHKGQISEQIDIVIFDRHYSPFLFRQNGQIFIPAESVYAVIEVKQELNNANLTYAAKKIQSVRRLERTSAPIVDCGNVRKPRELHNIVGGILCLSGEINSSQENKILSFTPSQIINIGCSLKSQSFLINSDNQQLVKSRKEDALIFFFLKLLSLLQSLGTVPPMRIDKYANAL